MNTYMLQVFKYFRGIMVQLTNLYTIFPSKHLKICHVYTYFNDLKLFNLKIEYYITLEILYIFTINIKRQLVAINLDNF